MSFPQKRTCRELQVYPCGRVAPPHATEVAFFGLLRHRTRVDVVEDVYLEFYRQLVFAELMLCWS